MQTDDDRRRYPTQEEAEAMWDQIASTADPRDATIIRAFKSQFVAKTVQEGIKTAETKANLAPARNHKDWADFIFSLPIFHNTESPEAERAKNAATRLMRGGRLSKEDIMNLRLVVSSCLEYGRNDGE